MAPSIISSLCLTRNVNLTEDWQDTSYIGSQDMGSMPTVLGWSRELDSTYEINYSLMEKGLVENCPVGWLYHGRLSDDLIEDYLMVDYPIGGYLKAGHPTGGCLLGNHSIYGYHISDYQC